MQATINIHITQQSGAQVANTANAIFHKEATQKIIMFIAILTSLVAAVNL